MKIAFIGLGAMGLLMARRIALAGDTELVLFDISAERLERAQGLGRLASSHQSGAHIRRDDFDHLQFGGSELVAQRLAVGMDGCLCGAIGWRDGHRQECESGGDGEDCTVPLF